MSDNLVSNSKAAKAVFFKFSALRPVCFSTSLNILIPYGLISNLCVSLSNCAYVLAKSITLSCNLPGSLIDASINANGSTNVPIVTPNLWNVDANSIAPSGSIALSAN